MKSVLLSFLLAAGLCSSAVAQNEQGYIGLSVGPSIPVGNFASTDLNNETAGLAKPGAIFDISFAYPLGQGSFGIMGLLRGQANPFDAQALADELARMSPGTAFTVEAKPWSVGGLMAGGYGVFYVTDRTSFEARAMIGFMNASSPEIKIKTGSDWVRQSSVAGNTVGFLVGAGFRFDISKRMYLLTMLDYMGEKPEFKDYEITSSTGENAKDTFSQPMGAINLSIGLAFKL